jgi:hypothetical protein
VTARDWRAVTAAGLAIVGGLALAVELWQIWRLPSRDILRGDL